MKGSPVLFHWIQSISDRTLGLMSLPLDTGVLSADSSVEDHSAHQGAVDCTDSPKPEVVLKRPLRRVSRTDSGRPIFGREHSIRKGSMNFTADQIFTILNDYNRMQQREVFNKQLISCLVCYDEQLGQNCMRFNNCGHTFCKSCVTQYLELRVKEGSVVGLKCLATSCATEISQQDVGINYIYYNTQSSFICLQVRELLSEELFQRYDELLLRRTLETMGDVANCPRLTCQEPVRYASTSIFFSMIH